jgi:hypothetical protein
MNSGKFAAFLPDLFFYTVNVIANKKEPSVKGGLSICKKLRSNVDY